MHQRFTPYGTLLARDSAGSSMPKGFHIGWTGREYDAETGFTFHRARYYSPDLRRWTQEDPIGYAGGGNLYAYVGGAVMEARDPSGLTEELSSGRMGIAEQEKWLADGWENFLLFQAPGSRIVPPDGGSSMWDPDSHLRCVVYEMDGSCGAYNTDGDDAIRRAAFGGADNSVTFGGGGGGAGAGAGRCFPSPCGKRSFAITYTGDALLRDRYHSGWRSYDNDVEAMERARVASNPRLPGYLKFCTDGRLDGKQGRFEIFGRMTRLGGMIVFEVNHHFFRPTANCDNF